MPASVHRDSLDLSALQTAYQADARPVDVIELVHARIEDDDTPGIWIHRASREALIAAALKVERRRDAGARLPLYGVPFAVKDNIDVAYLPTTAACPDFAYLAGSSAHVVERLVDAGAIVVGKTNLDQFATGLVGVRSPYGVPPNPFDRRYISGGSSSGSAAAVARGHVTFALGTDTAGSGRVPASFNNLVGLKPSRGLLSCAGVVPACRSLDCVSVLALTCEDAVDVAEVAAAYDPLDPYSRPEADQRGWRAAMHDRGFTFGIPRLEQREFFGDSESARLFDDARQRLEALGGHAAVVDLTPFTEASALLYDGPWIAERFADLEWFLKRHPDSLLPVTRQILERGAAPSAAKAFRALHRLEELKRTVARAFDGLDVLALPTTPTVYRIDEIAADPIGCNARLGVYTQFMNLLDLSAVALPNGFRSDGLPSGITLAGLWGWDAQLLAIASAFHQALGGTMGARGLALPSPRPREAPPSTHLRLAVVGAHLSGEPLNPQLTTLGARIVRATRTAPCYRLYALGGPPPARPGLVRVASPAGTKIEVEVWELSRTAFGTFFSNVPPPLSIGTIELEDGERVAGFLCESYALADAQEISEFGGWKRYRTAALH
jgi:allophanate hydrolase